MFTLEESALFVRLLRFLGWLLLATTVAGAFWILG